MTTRPAQHLSLALLVLSLFLNPWPRVARAQPDDVEAWRVVEAPNFTIHTNATVERGKEIALSLELFRGVFARLAPSLELRSPAPTKIIAFRDARSFTPYKTRADSGGARVLGQFLSHPDGNYLTIDAGTESVGSFAVIYHEYVHYFVRHNFPGVPLWFNEGLAEYYSTFAVQEGVVHVGRPVKRHVRWLKRDPEFSLSGLLEVTRQSAEYHEGQKAGRFYATSWALVHYLLSGGAERADQIADFLFALQDGAEPIDAFEQALGMRLSSIEEKLKAYVQAGDFPQAEFDTSSSSAGSSSGAARARAARPQDILFHLGDLLAHMGRRNDAEEHFKLALAYDPRHPESHAGLAYVRDLEGRYEEAEVLHGEAAASSDPLVHLLHGRHLLRRLQIEPGKSDELAAAARATLSHAMELDAGYAEARVLFGMAHLVGDVDPSPGIVALTKAHDLLPQRHDVPFHLLRLYLKDKNFDKARRVLENKIEGRADDEMVFAAQEEFNRSRLLHEASMALEDDDGERAVELFDEAISVTSDPGIREQMETQLRALQEHLESTKRL